MSSILINLGADLKFTNGVNLSPLHLAAGSDHEDTVKLLLGRRFDINAFNQSFGTPLCCAAAHARRNVVNLLLESGANIHESGGGPGSPLYADCLGRDVEIVRIFLRKGIRINLERPVELYTLRFIRTHVPTEVGAYGSYQPIHVVAQIEGEKVIKLLAQSGAGINATRKQWEMDPQPDASQFSILDSRVREMSALELAVCCGNLDAMQALLDCGADLDSLDNEGTTPLMDGTLTNSPTSTKAFPAAGA